MLGVVPKILRRTEVGVTEEGRRERSRVIAESGIVIES